MLAGTAVTQSVRVFLERGRLRAATHVLAAEVEDRKRAEAAIQKLTSDLEKRVLERTADLKKTSDELRRSQRTLMNLVRDLNERTADLQAANEKLKDLDRLKSLFIASMSHELRTPLNSIIGFSSILLNEWIGPLTSEQKENLSSVLRSGKHLLALINDVIDVTKIEAGKVDVKVEDFDLHDMVQETVALVAQEIRSRHLALNLQVERVQLHTDRRRLMQCLLNLVSNAVKFTEKGSIDLRARLSEDRRRARSGPDRNSHWATLHHPSPAHGSSVRSRAGRGFAARRPIHPRFAADQ